MDVHFVDTKKVETEITCSICGKKAKVPFKPDGVRPVYCKECYAQRKPYKNKH